MEEPKRNCMLCKHVDINPGSARYSEWTPGEGFNMECEKKHWNFSQFGTDKEFVACLLTANTCPDYEFNPKVMS